MMFWKKKKPIPFTIGHRVEIMRLGGRSMIKGQLIGKWITGLVIEADEGTYFVADHTIDIMQDLDMP